MNYRNTRPRSRTRFSNLYVKQRSHSAHKDLDAKYQNLEEYIVFDPKTKNLNLVKTLNPPSIFQRKSTINGKPNSILVDEVDSVKS
jgi:hypothetical protein